MAQFVIGKLSEIEKANPYLAQVGNLSVAIYRHDNGYFAYLNRCPHQGGPACEGAIVRDGDIRMRSDADLDSNNRRSSIVCPWHGWGFEIETGLCRSNSGLRLRSFEVLVEGDSLAIIT